MSAPIDPGWYPDPRDAGALRYFDGSRWTEETNPPTPGSGPAPSAVPARAAAPSALRAVPRWAWAVIVVASLVVLVALIVTVVGLAPGPTGSPPESSAGTVSNPASPHANPLRSELLPDLTFPAGSVVAGHRPGEAEIWGVPLSFDDTVRALRRKLPIGDEYDRMPWGAEHLDASGTAWAWGTAERSLSVRINRNNAGSTNVYVDRTG